MDLYRVSGYGKSKRVKAWASNGNSIKVDPEMASIVFEIEKASLWPFEYAKSVANVWINHEDYENIEVTWAGTKEGIILKWVTI